MAKKKLNKNIRLAMTSSMGRFLSIFSLMALGAFTLVGLKMSGPDMRTTAEDFYNKTNLADITVTSTYGLDKTDKKIIDASEDSRQIEYGYLEDVTIGNSDKSMRILSKPKNISEYELMKGRLPKGTQEIALDYLQKDNYKLGQEIKVKEVSSNKNLKNTSFKIVGFVKSSEFIAKNDLGASPAGTGDLDSYATVAPEAFNSANYMIARLTFTDTKNLSAYSNKYRNLVAKHKDILKEDLLEQPDVRLEAIKKEPQKTLDENKEKIASVEESLKVSEDKINKQEKQLKEAQMSGASVASGLEQVNEAKKELKSSKEEIAKQKRILADKQDDLDSLILPEYTVANRNKDTGYSVYLENTQRIDILSNAIPVLLFAIAALVTLTTMTRFVDEERINMGTLKALGYKNIDIYKKFIVYGLVAGLLGATLGIILGFIVLPNIVFEAYSSNSTFDKLKILYSLKYSLIAYLIAVLCTVLPAYLVARSELKEVPASLLLPKAPANGSKIILEYIKPFWNRLSFTSKVTFRNIFRYKKRMLMTIFGVAGATGLLVMGFGIRDSVTGIADEQYNKIMTYNMIAVEQETASKTDDKAIKKVLDNDKNVQNTENLHFEVMTSIAGSNNDEQSIQVFASKKDNLNPYIKLQNRKTKDKINLGDNGVVISEKLAKLLNAQVGSEIKLTAKDDNKVKMRVSGITEMYMGHYVFMNDTSYEKYFHKQAINNAYLVDLKKNSTKEVDSLSANLMKESKIATVIQVDKMRTTIETAMDGLTSVIGAIIILASLLALVVIYNLTNINVSERIRELSTIKVLGFYDKEVTLYIYRETIGLSILGILAGYIFGFFAHRFIMINLPPDNAMFDPQMLWTNFAISALIILVITYIIALLMHRKIKNVNMLDALKSVE